jgi:hypothetical protein
MANEQAAHENSTDVLADVVDRLLDKIDGDTVSVGDIIDAFEDRSIGALCTIVGLIAASPLVGAIPGMSIITGALVLLSAGQYVFGRNQPWIPETLRTRSIDREKLESGVKKARPWAEWIDSFIKPRLSWLVGSRIQRRIIAIFMCLLALVMFPLALVPWGILPPALGIVVFGIALLGRDGAFAAAGYLSVGLTLYLMHYLSGTIGSLFG